MGATCGSENAGQLLADEIPGLTRCELYLQDRELLSAVTVLSISASDSVLTQYGFLGTQNKSVTKTLTLHIAETPHTLLILIVALHESPALALVPERQLAELRCCPQSPVSSEGSRGGRAWSLHQPRVTSTD